MKKIILIAVSLFTSIGYSQATSDSTKINKKRVLETAEVDIISSFYSQDGDNAAVTGGIGTEKLTDLATSITISIPLNEDDVLTLDGTISAYSSASSSNTNPFDVGGGSDNYSSTKSIGSPWIESSGASKSDVWINGDIGYSHSSDDRNSIVGANINFANEYDYTSFGLGGSFTKLFNEKNTEISAKANIYLDSWQPIYPKELSTYIEGNHNLNSGIFNGLNIYDQNGTAINKNGSTVWSPLKSSLIDTKSRNTYTISLGFSQILSKRAQFSVFLDLVQQDGWLSNPMQRVYFGDRANYYVGNPASISNYTSTNNKDVFQLADDIERLPQTRFKVPVGLRFNYYINEFVTVRTYYRYYLDDWGVTSHTASIELPVKISDKFTLYPTYRYYIQTAADYFAPYEQLFSTDEFYTSDYDLSKFDSNQFGFGVSYTDIFTKGKIWKLGLKNVDLKYSNYKRNTGLSAGIISVGFKFIME